MYNLEEYFAASKAKTVMTEDNRGKKFKPIGIGIGRNIGLLGKVNRKKKVNAI